MTTPVRPHLFLDLFRHRSVLSNWTQADPGLTWLELTCWSINSVSAVRRWRWRWAPLPSAGLTRKRKKLCVEYPSEHPMIKVPTLER